MPRRFKTDNGAKCMVGKPVTSHEAYDIKRYADPTLARVARIRNGYRWQKVRAIFRAKHPLCCDPFGDHGPARPTPTECVHHVIPLSANDALAYNHDNLRSLCWSCHNRAEAIYEQDNAAGIRLFMTTEQKTQLHALCYPL